ncbi:MAG: addiction module antitoxin RelB [Calditrichaeota bacterium]|nr:MAG: addiction module antitoxin RelB [Calditrichota bacterium]MBL1204538.1 addiction module antitoxin RelB [Calditrichota bacterium]NOG44366.1 addiction module protein [Calditrichota bacterium]
MDLNINKMSISEKLKTMEVLWDDICRNTPDFSSPQWHENVLKAREKNLREGKDNFVDWDRAKKDIRNSIE